MQLFTIITTLVIIWCFVSIGMYMVGLADKLDVQNEILTDIRDKL